MRVTSMPLLKPYRLLLVDDHRIFNDGLKSLLDAEPDLTVCGQLFTANDVLPAIQRLTPDLLLLDINLQGTNGLELGYKLLVNYPPLRILLLTMYNQPKLLEEAKRLGMHGYLLKESSSYTVLSGIRTVLAGGLFFHAGESVYAETSFGDDFARRLKLTFREVEIIQLIRKGLSSEEIAQFLHLSAETVKKHRKNIYFKLNITKVTELIEFANQNGI